MVEHPPCGRLLEQGVQCTCWICLRAYRAQTDGPGQCQNFGGGISDEIEGVAGVEKVVEVTVVLPSELDTIGSGCALAHQ